MTDQPVDLERPDPLDLEALRRHGEDIQAGTDGEWWALENRLLWQLFLGSAGTHGLQIIKASKEHPTQQPYFPNIQQGRYIVEALNAIPSLLSRLQAAERDADRLRKLLAPFFAYWEFGYTRVGWFDGATPEFSCIKFEDAETQSDLGEAAEKYADEARAALIEGSPE